MRESWTDERLDYLNHKVDAGFKRVDERFDEGFKRIDEKFEDIDQRFGETDKRSGERFEDVDRRLARLESQFDQLNQALLGLSKSVNQLGIGIIVTMFTGFLTVLATTL